MLAAFDDRRGPGMLAACRIRGRDTGNYLDIDHHMQAVIDQVESLTGEREGESNTTTIETLRIFAKLGTESVMLMGVPGQAAVAVEILDGALRAATLAAITLLESTGMIDTDAAATVLDRSVPAVLGRGKRVGRIRAGAGLA